MYYSLALCACILCYYALQLSSLSFFFQSDIVCVYPMVHLAKATGVKLKSLDLSGNLLRGFNTVLNAICVSLLRINLCGCVGAL